MQIEGEKAHNHVRISFGVYARNIIFITDITELYV